MNAPDRVLILGYGNTGRRDDGLGPMLAERAAGWGLPGVAVETDLQLQIEDAVHIAAHDVVVFVDAAASGPAPYDFRRVEPRREQSFTTHSVSPGAVLGLARDHFGARTAGYVLAVRGRDFEGFGEALSDDAAAHLERAENFLADLLRNRRFEEAAAQEPRADTEPRGKQDDARRQAGHPLHR